MLRSREYRRVLIRRDRRTVQFLPVIPNREDLSDAGFELGATYTRTLKRSLPRARNVTTGLLERARAKRKGGVTIQVHSELATATAGVDGRAAEFRVALRPRAMNVTPPNGESLVDVTTDWEDPDNPFTVPEPARRTFAARLHFDQLLGPRTVDSTTFLIHKVTVGVGRVDETDMVPEPVEDVGVLLARTRLGEVRVDLTPPRHSTRSAATGSRSGAPCGASPAST